MAIVTHTPRPMSRAGGRPRRVLVGLGELGDGSGIAFLDQNITAIRGQVDFATTAAKITAACSIVGALASVVMIVRSLRGD